MYTIQTKTLGKQEFNDYPTAVRYLFDRAKMTIGLDLEEAYDEITELGQLTIKGFTYYIEEN